MQEKSKIIIVISILLISSTFVLSSTLQVEPTGSSRYCDEWYKTFKIGTTIDYLHLHRCTAGETVTMECWSPSQDFKVDSSWYGPVTRTATGSDFNFYFGKQLTEYGSYMFLWEINGPSGAYGSGHGFSTDLYRAKASITSFTVPESVMAGGIITATYSVKNTGDLNGQLKIKILEGMYGSGGEIYIQEGIPLAIGQTYYGSFTVDADSLTLWGEQYNELYLNLVASLRGENPGYQDTWVRLLGSAEVYNKLINYTIPTYTLKVLTNPTECNVTVIGQTTQVDTTINSGANGLATVGGLQEDTYVINVSKTGYATAEATVTMDRDQALQITLTQIAPSTPGFEILTFLASLTIFILIFRRKK